MKRLFTGLILISFFSSSTLGDGYITFVNRVTGVFDAPIFLSGSSRPFDQSCFHASLILLGSGSSGKLYPSTTFRNESEGRFPYLYPVVVAVPGKQPGDTVTLQVHTYKPGGELWGVSSSFEAVLGTLDEPGNLKAMTSFTVLSDPGVTCGPSQSNQGYILFVNRMSGIFDAPISVPGVWPGQHRLRAALKIVGPGLSRSLLPETNFRESEAANAYLHPVVVPVPGRLAGDTVSVQVEIYTSDNQLMGQSAPFDVVLGTLEEPGILSGMTPMQTPGPIIPEPCSTPPPLQLDLTVHGDHVMLYPQGLCENALTFDVEFSEDLVTWSVLPSEIRDTIVPERNRYYRIKTPQSPSGN